jgi:hypothetical protein
MPGLTPPAWWIGESRPSTTFFARQQRVMWDWYVQKLHELGHIDLLIVNGDAVDGKAKKSGGTELLTADMREQAYMAAQCIKEAHADKVWMTFGTSYHVSPDGEDWEVVTSDMVKAEKMEAHLFETVEGVNLDVRHHVSGSGTPHGRHTATSKERLWNVVWHVDHGVPLSELLIRSHVHYHKINGGFTHLEITTPCLQGFNSKFGERRCSGDIDLGMLHFDIHDGEYEWRGHRLQLVDINSRGVLR